MKKRLFQILDDMNVHDIENDTRLIQLCPDVISIDTTKKGIKVTMGAALDTFRLYDQMNGKKRLVLMVIDGNDYDHRVKTSEDAK